MSAARKPLRSHRLASATVLMLLMACGNPAFAALVVDEVVNLTGTLGFSGEGPQEADGAPPDTMGAVGQKHVVELNNKSFRVYEKGNNVTLEELSITDFFKLKVGLDVVDRAFDPRILYDPGEERWLAVAVDRSHRQPTPVSNSVLVAASVSSDPTGAWVGGSIDSDPDGTHWADFPRIGINAGNVTIAAEMVDLSSTSGADAKLQSIWLIPRNEFFAGNAASALPILKKDRTEVPERAQPVVDLEAVSSGPPKSTLIGATDLAEIFSWNPARVEWFAGSGPVLGPVQVVTPELDSRGAGNVTASDGNGGSVDVDTDSARFSGSVVFQNGSYWAAHTVTDVETQLPAAIEWMEIDAATNTLVQSGIIRDEQQEIRSLYYPSIAVNDSGDVFVGFSGSSKDRFIGAYGAAGSTVNGVTTFGDLIEIRPGGAPYQRIGEDDPYQRNRWGDYSATVVDPDDDSVFWTFQEFAPDLSPVEPNAWATVMAAYQLEESTGACCGISFHQVDLEVIDLIDEVGMSWAGSVDAIAIDGTAMSVGASAARVALPVPAAPDSTLSLAFQSAPGNHILLDDLDGYLAGQQLPAALDSVGVPPLIRVGGGEAFADFFNPYDFLIDVSNVALFAGSDPAHIALSQFPVTTGQLVDGIPTAFTLYPGQTYRLSFGDISAPNAPALLASADFARASAPEMRFRAATAIQIASVSEPGSLVLLGLGLVVTARRASGASRRRRV